MDRQQFRRIVEMLECEPEAVSENWSARQKRLRTKHEDGDVPELATVLRDLGTRAAKSAPAAAERD